MLERYGSWSTVASRFYRWREAGIWERIWSQLQNEADVCEQIDWEIHLLDGTVVRAHQHAAEAKKRVPKRKP